MPLQDDQLCIYKYSAEQDDFNDEVKLNVSIITTVVVSCDASEINFAKLLAE